MHQIKPHIHLNGSHPNVLAENCGDAYRKLSDALDAMGLLCPHGRDYQGGGDYEEDRREHWRRMSQVQELMDQYKLEARWLQKEERHG